jgi:hypothetical protein
MAARAQRDLLGQTRRYPELFDRPGFDESLLATVTLANAFSAPWHDADELRALNRATLWAFALDWRVDVAATDRTELVELNRRCLAIADGATPAGGDQLDMFLADVRDDLCEAANFAQLRPVWREELRRTLSAMTQEWEWKMAPRRDPPSWPVTVTEYLGNSDNLGSSFVHMTHWIATGGPEAAGHVDAVLSASRATQAVIRVLNDMATFDRDVSWGDLNLLRLDGGPEAAGPALDHLLARHRGRVRALRPVHGRFAIFLHRQVEFCRGFYPVADFWGEH